MFDINKPPIPPPEEGVALPTMIYESNEDASGDLGVIRCGCGPYRFPCAHTLLFDFVRCGVQIQENVLEYAVIDCCST